ncbi:MAG: hypothetical protein IT299_06775 [Dehalococcoidia bacterium]|nr:hypothetical protein [Dehalococcoidia bacterium]
MQRLASTWEGRLVLGAALWACVVAALGAVVITGGDREPADPWRLVLLAFLAMPFAVAVVAEIAAPARPARRAMVLGAMAVPAVGATLLSYLTALPSLVMLAGAALLAIRDAASGIPTIAGGVGVVAAAAMAALWVAGLAMLFRVDDERCVDFATGYACTSDVVTAAEAGTGLAVLAASALLGALVLGLEPLHWRRARNESPGI